MRRRRVLDVDAQRARQALARYHFRWFQLLSGTEFPDPRDQELRDRGAELAWRVGVRRREMRRRAAS